MPDVQYRVDSGRSKQSMEQTNLLLKAVSEIQLDFIRAGNARSWLEQTLQAFLDVTNSEYGFIGTVHHNVDGSPRLQPQVISNPPGKQSSQEPHKSSLSEELPVQNVGSLSGETLRTGELFISNVPVADCNLGGPSSDDSELTAFMSIPLRLDNQLVGVVGVASRPGGYDTDLAHWLEPLCITCATLIIATKNENARLNADEQWQAVVENVPDSILLVGRDGEIHFVNRVQGGYDRKLVLQSTIFDYQPVEHHEKIRHALQRVFDDGESVSYETVGRRKPDEWRTYVCRVVPVNLSNGVRSAIIIATDVTEERAARDAEARQFGILKAITEGTSELIFAKDRQSRPVFVNDAIARSHGMTVEQMLGKSEEAFFSETSLQKSIEDDQRIMQTGQTETFEEVLSLASGERNFLTTKSPWRDQNGEVIGIIGVAKDITEWKETQTAIHQQREHLQAIIEGTPGCVKLVDQDGKLLQMNAAGLAMCEAATTECVVGKQIVDLVAPDFRAAFTEFHKRVCSGTPDSMQFEIIGLQGTHRWVESHAVPLPIGPDGAIVHLSIALDITDARVAEETIAAQQSQLLHVSRLSSMGQMVAVISHEITQPLAAIANYSSACELLAEQPAPDIGKLQEYLAAITDQSARAGQILGRVRNFVKHSVEHRIQTDLIQLTKDSLNLVNADLRSRQISVTSTFPNQAVFASVDPVQIQQVLVNLISNAGDAIESLPTHRRKIAIGITADDESVTVEITDSGSGLPVDSQHQLFDPFYTSKPSGMGMGLSICSDILRSHSGTITAENAPNAGARFRFTLPRSENVTNE
tara:strand:- start:95301 stop:97736 length:2436 start_codon:yes stop_codon:yes gene_type:complete